MILKADDLKLFQKGLILIAVPVMFEFIFVAALSILRQQAEHDAQLARHSTAISQAASEISVANWKTERALIFYAVSSMPSLDNVAGSPQVAEEQFNRSIGEIKENLQLLEGLVKDNPIQEANFKQLQPIALRLLHAWETVRQQPGSGTYSGNYMMLVRMPALRAALIELEKELFIAASRIARTEKEHDYLEAAAHSRQLVEQCIDFGLLVNVALAIGLAFFFSKQISGRLAVITDNALRFSKEEQLHPTLAGSDEIGQLDEVFHSMAAALSEAARKERMLIRNALDVICSIDKDGRFVSVSPASRRVWGYEPEELIGRLQAEIVADDLVETLRKEKKLIADKSTAHIESRVERKDGGIIHTSWSAIWSETDQELFCVAHDISDRKEMERMKQEFVSMVSHDLRAPLTSVLAFHEFLSTGLFGTLSPDGEVELAAADGNIQSLINLINNLLDLEKLAAGEMELKLELIPLSCLIEDSISAVSTFAEQRKIPIKCSGPDLEVEIDGERVKRVLVNLLSNAIKFSPPNATVSLETLQGAGWVELRVADCGRGIPEEQREKIFQKYKQGDDISDNSEKKTIGLGLPISKSIIEAHSGKIGVDSEVGKGSTFWFRLPMSHQKTEQGNCN
jgi:PAS domain S-box-containing protein